MGFLAPCKNILKRSNFSVIVEKFFLQFGFQEKKRAEARSWCENVATDYEAYAKKKDAKLWEESKVFAKKLEQDALKKLASIPVKLGGGGNYPLLYFLTRLLKPKVLVETGVAAGYSSKAFLTAIQKNKTGKLYSSDFPYFRLKDPEKYIGILVDDELKANWELYIEGDRKNLTKILKKVDNIDLFHYDSDKTYRARKNVMEIVKSHLTEKSVIIMDDVQDNLFFKDFVIKFDLPYKVFSFGGKYIGAIGLK